MTITAAERAYLTEIEIRKYTQKTIRSYKNKNGATWNVAPLLYYIFDNKK